MRTIPRRGCWVHPRVGGGADTEGVRRDFDRGPSPRGRGSPTPGREGCAAFGSIPAWAGEPSSCRLSGWCVRVHPRVGGGASTASVVSRPTWGPSPRGRGSLDPGPAGRLPVRSIPAWAGEPRCRSRSPASSRVHPRVGGGARSSSSAPRTPTGPSPRGRGSHLDFGAAGVGHGSIPAWAGEPWKVQGRRVDREVHPRVGGGAFSVAGSSGYGSGPSPRGRGSQLTRQPHLLNERSIPAWAGEPDRPVKVKPLFRVHPRVGGGAGERDADQEPARGPSPRGRGSHPGGHHHQIFGWSIPAWAGEPVWGLACWSGHGVHPRVGGGAAD